MWNTYVKIYSGWHVGTDIKSLITENAIYRQFLGKHKFLQNIKQEDVNLVTKIPIYVLK